MTGRFRLIFTLILGLGCLLVVRLFLLQIVHANYYKNLAEKQYNQTSAKDFSRGNIYLTQKDSKIISVAGTKKGYLVSIKPKSIVNEEETYQKLSSVIVNLNKDDFLTKASKKDDPYEEIAHYISEEQAEKIKNLKIQGVSLFAESWRYYPADRLASKVLGFVGWKEKDLTGLYGIEKSKELILSRLNSKPENTNSFFEIFLEAKRKIFSNSEEEGDVVLTIEPQVQLSLEKEVQGVLEKYSAQSAGGIVIEPKTGKILAMTGKPDFDPNKYGEEKNHSVFLNPHVQSVFEMGSIVKPLTMASAIDAGAVLPETEYIDEGSVTVDGRLISNFDGKARGRATMQDVLNNSLNTGVVFVMKKMGKDAFRNYFKSFGFGEKTGIDLPDELSGIIKNLDSPRMVEYATASFGQGIAMTPIQMVTALSALGNGGLLMRPYVIERLEFKGGLDKQTKPTEIRRVLKPETSKTISDMLVTVVDKALLGGTVKLEHYSIAAKTGTAQIKGQNEGYSEDQFLHTFFGYAPARDPKFLVFLYVEKPQGVEYASHSLTPFFINEIKFLLNYYDVPPDR